MESYQELNTETLTEAESEQLKQLLDRFERGNYLTRAEQETLHELRARAGGRRWLRFVQTAPDGSQVHVSIPDNNRGDPYPEPDRKGSEER